jgi:hypothetical protein
MAEPTREELQRFLRDKEAMRRSAKLYVDGIFADAEKL